MSLSGYNFFWVATNMQNWRRKSQKQYKWHAQVEKYTCGPHIKNCNFSMVAPGKLLYFCRNCRDIMNFFRIRVKHSWKWPDIFLRIDEKYYFVKFVKNLSICQKFLRKGLSQNSTSHQFVKVYFVILCWHLWYIYWIGSKYPENFVQNVLG